MTELIAIQQHDSKSTVKVQDVERILAVGKILLSVLTPDEINYLNQQLNRNNQTSIEPVQGKNGKQVTPAALDAGTLLS